MTERLERRPRVPRIQKEATPDETGRVRERNFDVIPTHISGVFLLVDHNTDPDLTKLDTRKLKSLGNAYVARSETIRHLEELQEKPHEEIETLAVDNPGLRGLRDTNTGSEVQINPHTNDVFDEALLEASLETQRENYIHKKVSVTIELDPDRDDVKGFTTSVRRRLKRQGLSSDEIEKQLSVKSSLRVDKAALEKMIKKGKIALLPGAWTKQIDDWKIVPRVIPSQDEIAETEEASRKSN